MPTALILYGPKAVGKSWIAQVLAEGLYVYHWLAEVAAYVQDALAAYDLVSVEATGAWERDRRLARDRDAGGTRVCRVWVSTPRAVALRRLQTRTTPRVPVSADEASWIYDAATARAATTGFDLKIDTSSGITPEQVIAAVRPLVAEQHP